MARRRFAVLRLAEQTGRRQGAARFGLAAATFAVRSFMSRLGG
jgi:hypothetical protein